MPDLRTSAAVLAVAAAAFTGIDGIAVATTGQPLLLGKSNSADHATRIAMTTRGTALQLSVKAGQPPFTVNSTTKVANLDADLLDGLSSDRVINRVWTYAVPAMSASAGNASFTFPRLPPGIYLASYSITARTSDGATYLDCALRNEAAGGYQLANRGPATGSYLAVSGSGVIDARKATFSFVCFAFGGTFSWLVDQSNYSTFSFLRLDQVDLSMAAIVVALPAVLPLVYFMMKRLSK